MKDILEILVLPVMAVVAVLMTIFGSREPRGHWPWKEPHE